MTRLDSPLLLLAGVPKCGTTSLFAALRAHPALEVPVRKEPQYFALTPALVAEHLGWYRSLFPADAGHLLDGSTLTCLSEAAPELVDRHAPGARVVLVVRDPAKRVFSAYLHMVKQVPFAERRPFEDVLAGMEARPEGVGLAEWEDAQIREAGRAGDLRLDYFRPDHHIGRYHAPFETDFLDPLAVYRYFGGSLYRAMIARWRAVFGDRLHVVVFERLVREPARVLAEVQAFAGLDGVPLELSHENEGRLPRGGAVRLVLGFFRRSLLGRRIGDAVRRAGVVGMSSRLGGLLWSEKPSLDPGQYARTRAVLAEEYAHWLAAEPDLEALWAHPSAVRPSSPQPVAAS